MVNDALPLCFASRGPLCVRLWGSSSHHIGLVPAVPCYTTTFAALNSISKISTFRLLKLGLLSPVGVTTFTTGCGGEKGEVSAQVVARTLSQFSANTINALYKFTEISERNRIKRNRYIKFHYLLYSQR